MTIPLLESTDITLSDSVLDLVVLNSLMCDIYLAIYLLQNRDFERFLYR